MCLAAQCWLSLLTVIAQPFLLISQYLPVLTCQLELIPSGKAKTSRSLIYLFIFSLFVMFVPKMSTQIPALSKTQRGRKAKKGK